MILVLETISNCYGQSNNNLIELISKTVQARSLDTAMTELTSNFCVSKTLNRKDEFYDCSLSSELIKGLFASKIFSCLDDIYVKELSNEEYGLLSINLSAYGHRKLNSRSREKREENLKADFRYLRAELAKRYKEVDYSFREDGEAGEQEEITYQASLNQFKLVKLRGGCFNDARIFLYFEKGRVKK